MPFLEEQLNFVIWVSQMRGPLLDPFFRFLNYFDTSYFYFILIPLVWIGFSYRWGIRLAYLSLISNNVIHIVKNYFEWPRPSHLVPGLGLFDFQSYSFPSGGAQMSFLLGGLLIYYGKSRLTTIIGLTYIFLISFSRIYLGVHFPGDVLGGWFFAAILLFLFIRFIEPIEAFLKKKGLIFAFIISQSLPLLYLAITHRGVSEMAGAMAMGLGICLSFHYKLYLPPPKTILIGLFRALLAVAGVYLFYFFWPKQLSRPVQSFTISLWLSLIASPICNFFLRSKNK
ncbi:MAG TPA: phosphatase PAP2 family protein [Chlamydiales bacterium]|nr:phosphatase PAP2 family protein [Chlamydiales bacterium]